MKSQQTDPMRESSKPDSLPRRADSGGSSTISANHRSTTSPRPPIRSSLLTSTLFHGFLLLVMALIIVSGDRTPTAPAIETTFRTKEVIPPDPLPIVIPVNPLIEETLRLGKPNRPLIRSDILQARTNPLAPRFNSSLLRPTAGAGFDDVHLPVDDLTEEVAGIDKLTVEVAGIDKKEKTAVSFFGIESMAKSYVFIVDASSSMRKMAGPRMNRFQRAVGELNRSLTELRAANARPQLRGGTTRFFVIFYNTMTYPLFSLRANHQLVPVTEATIRSARRWVESRTTARGTLPERSLRLALFLKPDVIYFLTDGRIPLETRQLVREQNKHSTIIHTICIANRDGQQIMRAIARDNNGEYRLVW